MCPESDIPLLPGGVAAGSSEALLADVSEMLIFCPAFGDGSGWQH